MIEPLLLTTARCACATEFPKLADVPWLLLGVRSARLDVGTRDFELDEARGLNCAWYADVLPALTSS